MQHGLGRKSARQTGVSSRDAYLFLNLADEAAVVAGRFLRDPAAARRRLAVRCYIFVDTSYVVMIPADAAREAETRSVESCSAQRRDAQPKTPTDQRDVWAPSSKRSTSLIILRRPSSWRRGWLGSSRPA